MNLNPEEKPFPILKLPFLPLSNVLHNFDYLEMLDFSFVSKKCQFVIQLIKFADFEICLNFQRNRSPKKLLAIIFYRRKKCIFEFSIDELNNRKKYLKRKDESTEIMDDKHMIWIDSAKEWTDYICGLFRMELNYIYLPSDGSMQEMSDLSEWINNRKNEIDYCEFRGDDTNSDSIELFFKKAEFSIHNLSFGLEQPYLRKPLPFEALDLTEVYLSSKTWEKPVTWITVNDVINFKYRRIVMGVCQFNENDINRIIRSWLDGNNPQMEFFTVALKPLNFDLVLDGIEFEKKDRMDKIMFVYDFMGREECHIFEGGFDIRREDGTLATIQQIRRFWSDTSKLWFAMAVWPYNKFPYKGQKRLDL
ncbi:hypothetical protein GCK72_014790 [Caenorhabditis remanei]|uniref:F-box domain-containing protein n=1 Tax=Caenorhabditis remanei TaxID=31234 RepID=A0A6A5GVE4_CAERE|nr:hypothetical protein GCK72_014790 [Caenorhabditis remanei]KAF1758332.1 hypothetical protein GCK72_014790 [Caenorhabditis remanei]